MRTGTWGLFLALTPQGCFAWQVAVPFCTAAWPAWFLRAGINSGSSLYAASEFLVLVAWAGLSRAGSPVATAWVMPRSASGLVLSCSEWGETI